MLVRMRVLAFVNACASMHQCMCFVVPLLNQLEAKLELFGFKKVVYR